MKALIVHLTSCWCELRVSTSKFQKKNLGSARTHCLNNSMELRCIVGMFLTFIWLLVKSGIYSFNWQHRLLYSSYYVIFFNNVHERPCIGKFISLDTMYLIIWWDQTIINVLHVYFSPQKFGLMISVKLYLSFTPHAFWSVSYSS